jgi:hypothetical protein
LAARRLSDFREANEPVSEDWLATGIENAPCEAFATGRLMPSIDAIGSARVTKLTGMLDVAVFAASVTAGSSRH